MNKIDALLDVLSKIYQILVLVYNSKYHGAIGFDEDPQMDRQEVKDYLGISESTYKRKVKEGVLRPLKLPGGDKYYKSQLLGEFKESKRRGRV
ncbi:DNA-binding protein [Pedobacter psychrodurus]|uniref:DNA-binding protein n=1 Tax=Pedobacter psychrodurus TaxID=2530456 RepID=A0A4R0Q638_9SPHI|nr:DNA-binding protein [Pedobacter psychrodurus]TCD28649.1 DNA-binding protein [Pedobacter psychrodurus]